MWHSTTEYRSSICTSFSHLALQIRMQSLECIHISLLLRPAYPETLLFIWFRYHMKMHLRISVSFDSGVTRHAWFRYAINLHGQPLDEPIARCSAVYCSCLLRELVLSSLRPAGFRRARHQELRSTSRRVFSVSPTRRDEKRQ